MIMMRRGMYEDDGQCGSRQGEVPKVPQATRRKTGRGAQSSRRMCVSAMNRGVCVHKMIQSRVSQSATECYRVLQSVTECYKVLESVTEYDKVLQSIKCVRLPRRTEECA